MAVKTLEQIMQEWNKASNAVVMRKGLEKDPLPRIPFSTPIMNYQTYGGIPRRRIIEFFGPESSGKTTSALDIVKNAQILFRQEWEDLLEDLQEELATATKTKKAKSTIKMIEDKIAFNKEPQQVAYFDLENTLDLEWAQKLGVDTADLYLIKPEQDTAEQILQHVIDMAKSGQVGLIVLDSLPYMVSQNLMDEDLEKRAYAGISGALTEFSRKVQPALTSNNVTLIGINQVREDMNSSYGGQTTPGGKMWKHACSVRLKFRKGDYFDENVGTLTRQATNPYGNFVESVVEKSKAFRPNRKKVSYALSYIDGILIEEDLVDVAIEYKIVTKAGAWYSVIDPETGELMTSADGDDYKYQGKARIVEALKENDELFNLVMTQVHDIISDETVRGEG